MSFESLLNAAKFRPQRLVFPNAWVGHIPFAAWLIKTLRPSIFVELGTHSGNSYLSFCQAVDAAGLPTRCYAVDTWKGDEHASFYDETVYQELVPYHEERYSAFSQLLRMTFDDAVSYFEDESIELLHIDGLHTYEAIKHDFDTWMPKLAPHAVVIFHDTNVHEMGFGVWELWSDLCRQYPLNLEFVHAHGLGVLQLSQGQEQFNLNWMIQDSPDRRLLIDYFANLGLRVIESYKKQELENAVQTLTTRVAETNQTVQALTAQIAEKEQTITEKEQTIAEKEQTRQELTAQLNQAIQNQEIFHAELRKIINSRLWKLFLWVQKILNFALGAPTRFLKKRFKYLANYGVTETFLAMKKKGASKPKMVKFTPAVRESLQNILQRLNITCSASETISALIGEYGDTKTSQIMANIFEVETFISASKNKGSRSITQASQLPKFPPSTRRKNIFFIASEFPSPHHGGGNRVLNFMKALSQNNNIYLCAAFHPPEHEKILPLVEKYCKSILKISYVQFGENQAKIREWLHDLPPMDIVHYEWPRSLENYATDFGKYQLFTYMEAVSLRLLMDMEQMKPLSKEWLDKFDQLAYALQLEFVKTSQLDARVAVSTKDAEFFRNISPFQEYVVLNHGLSFEEFTLPEIVAEPNTLVFVGNYMHYPNAEAMELFFNEIWENIRKEIPDVRIYIVGTNPTENLLLRSDGKHIIVTDTVPDVRPYIQKATVCIAPLISGAGLRGKLIEYAALKRTFVATSIAATDFDFKDGTDYFCADTAREFSQKVIQLLKSPELVAQMAENAYITASKNYDTHRLTGFLLSLYDYLGSFNED
jgi:glycosyltransferase involved in cell wall biosynthesis